MLCPINADRFLWPLLLPLAWHRLPHPLYARTALPLANQRTPLWTPRPLRKPSEGWDPSESYPKKAPHMIPPYRAARYQTLRIPGSAHTHCHTGDRGSVERGLWSTLKETNQVDQEQMRANHVPTTEYVVTRTKDKLRFTCAIKSRSSGAFSFIIALALSVLSSPVVRSTNDSPETGTCDWRGKTPKGFRSNVEGLFWNAAGMVSYLINDFSSFLRTRRTIRKRIRVTCINRFGGYTYH